MRGIRALLAIIMLGASATCLAQGGPPMITDDPGTLGNGQWEINVAATGRHGAFGSESELPLLDVNYGLNDRIQLKYEVPLVWANDAEHGSRAGLGNSQFGVKVRFYDAGLTGWQISTYPQVEMHGLHSSVRRGLAEERTTFFLPVEFQRTFGTFSANFELGRELRSHGADKWSGGLVLGHEWRQGLEGLAEIHARATAGFERSALALNVGARIGVANASALLASVGSELRNALDERASVFGYVGWQFDL